MPKVLPLKEFGQKGLNSDLPEWELSQEFLTDVNNIRIRDGKLLPFGGSESEVQLPVDFDPGCLQYVKVAAGNYWLIPGDNYVYVYDFSSVTDISNPSGYSGDTTDFWQITMMGEIPIINNKNHYPEYWDPQTIITNMVALPWDASNDWDAENESCSVIRSHKRFLFALDLVSSGTEIPDGVRWSSAADADSIPATWDPTDTTNFAGFTTLGTGSGRIIDGMSLRDAFVIYREKGIAVADYVGGDNVFEFRQLDTDAGLACVDGIIEANEVHYFIGYTDIYMNDGNEVESILHEDARRAFQADFNIEFAHRAFAIRNEISKEAWFCIPVGNGEYPTKAYIYNWKNDSWTVRDIDECTHGAYGGRDASALTWDTIPGNWDANTISWNQSSSNPGSDTVFLCTKPSGAGQQGDLLVADNLTSQPTGISALIERVGLALEGIHDTTTINRVYPRISGTGKVNIQLGSQDYPGAPIRWKDSEEFDPTTDRSITTRTTGELHCFRITNADDNLWEFSGLDLEYVYAGAR